MKKKNILQLASIVLLTIVLLFFTRAYQELFRYSELSARAKIVYSGFQNLSRHLNHAAVLTPDLQKASKQLDVASLFYTDSLTVMQEFALLKTTVRDSTNIQIVDQLATKITAELPWLLRSNVPDSIIHGRAPSHIAELQIIDSLTNAGIDRTHAVIDYRTNKLDAAISEVSLWMILFIVLASILCIYTIVSERKNVKSIQEKNEKRFRALIENYDAIIVIVDEHLIPFYRTPASERLTGYSITDRKGKSGMDTVHPEDNQALMTCLTEVKANPGKIVSHTFRIRHKQGHYIWVDSVFTNLLFDPAVNGIVINMRDVSERKKAEAEIIDVYKETKTVLSRISDSVVSVDNTWRYTFLNEAALAAHPFTREETLGKVIWDVHPEMKGTIFWDKYHEAMQTKKMVEVESYYAPMESWFSVKVYPSMDGITILYRNITEQKQAEDRIKQSEVFYRSLIEQASDAIFITNPQGKYIDVNTSACKLLEYSRQELLTMSATDVVFAEAKVKLVSKGFEELRNGNSDVTQLKLKRKDGTVVEVESNAKMLSDGRYVGIVRDITERKKSELILSQTVRELTDYKFALDEASIVSITDQKGIINHVSNNFCQISKYSREELIGQDHRIINSGYHSKEFMKSTWDTIARGEVWRGEIKNKTKDGDYFWVDTTIVPFNNGIDSRYHYMAIRYDITERKNAAIKLIENEQRFTVLMENMADAIVLSDEQSNLIYQSPSVTRILGYTWDERKGKKLSDYVHPDSLGDFGELQRTIHDNPGHAVPFQFQFLHKKGHYVWLEGVFNDLLHEPNVKAIVANYRDISDRREAEGKLLHERTLLRTIIDNLPDYIYVKDTQCRFLIVNKADLRLMNVDSEENVIGKTAVDVFGAEVGGPFLEDDEHVVRTGKPLMDHEELHVSHEGVRKFLLTTKVPLRDSNNSTIGLIGISRDISKQKQVELDLRNSNYFLEKAQKVGKIGHWISEIGQTGKLIWSTEACRIFGLKPGEFDGELETFFGFTHPEDREELKAVVNYAVENHESYSIDHRIILRNGNLKWVHEQGQATLDEHGNPNSLVGIVQDITEQKETQNEILKLNEELDVKVKIRTEQLQAANKEMEAFTYSVSHDLRSPLRIIDGYAQILIEDYNTKLDEEGQKTLGIIMSNAKKMGQLIDDLLNFSQIGRIEIRRSKVDMNKRVNEVIEELRLSGVAIPEALTIHPLVPAHCDPNLIKHVLVNLLSNAIKYSSTTKNPTIEVGMRNENNKLVYYVKDNGVGFDMTYYHKLFGVFQRLHSYDEFSGTGVGLAIVQRIIIRHGGSVWAESNVNQGATFFFSVD